MGLPGGAGAGLSLEPKAELSGEGEAPVELASLPGAVPELPCFPEHGQLQALARLPSLKPQAEDAADSGAPAQWPVGGLAGTSEGARAEGLRAEEPVNTAAPAALELCQSTEPSSTTNDLQPQPGAGVAELTDIAHQSHQTPEDEAANRPHVFERRASDLPRRAPSNAILKQESFVSEDSILYIHFSAATLYERCERTREAVKGIHSRLSRQWNLKLPVAWLRRLRATQVMDWTSAWFQTIETEDNMRSTSNIFLATLSLPEEMLRRFCARHAGVPNCLLYAPVFSFYADGSGTLEALIQWPNGSQKDSFNPMLLELALAKELLCDGEGLIKGIEPILILESEGTDLASVVHRLSDEPHEPTNSMAVKLLLQWGHSFDSGESRRVLNRSVRELVQFCCVRRQAVSLKNGDQPTTLNRLPSKDSEQEEAALLDRQMKLALRWPLSGEEEQLVSDRLRSRTQEVVAQCKMPIIDEVRHHTPFASEFYRFLEEQEMGDMIDTLAMEGVFSFQDFLEFSEKVLAVSNEKTRAANASFLRRYSAIGDVDQADSVKILSLYKDVREHQKELSKSLKERMYRFDDHESNSWAALFSTNCIETGLSSWPTRALLALFGILYIGFALLQLDTLLSEERYVETSDEFVAAEPKILKLSRVLDVVTSGLLSVFLLATVVVAKVHCVLAAKRILVAATAIYCVLALLGGVLDTYQCAVDGDGIGRACNGVNGFAQMTTSAILLISLLCFQRYTWIVALGSQGGYLFYIAWREEPKSLMIRLVYSAVGLAFLTTAALIYIKHQFVLRSARANVESDTLEFQQMWKYLMDSHQKELDELAHQAATIQAEISNSMHHQRMLAGAAPSTRGGKRRQEEKDIDELFKQAGEISGPFQKWVAGWSESGRVQPGCVKNPTRAIQKVVRSYGRDASCLTDLVRCTIVVNDASQILGCLKQILSKAEVCFQWSPRRSKETDETKIMSITNIKNRFDPKFNAAEQSLHYRDLLLNVEVGYVFSNGHVRFLPLCKWGGVEGLKMKRHICEIQVLVYNFHTAKKDLHRHYVQYRNIRVQ